MMEMMDVKALAYDAADPLMRPAESFTILVVDDEPDILEVFRYLLENEGYRVVSALNGTDALALVNDKMPDLVLLDVLLPDLDGYEVCRRMKDDPETMAIPVVMVTGVRTGPGKLEGVEAGADDYLHKPVNDVELKARVRSLLRVKALYDALEDQNHRLEERVAQRTKELQEALERVSSIDQLKSSFINAIAHELRTPLLQVKSAVSLLSEDVDFNSEHSTLINMAVQATSRLEGVINNIIMLASGMQIHQEPVLVSDMIDQAIRLTRGRSSRHEIEKQIAPDLAPVSADRRGLVHALQHLIENAMRLNGSEGVVEISASPLGDYGVRVAVRDYGKCLSDEEMAEIFEVDGATAHRRAGTGVGLALVKLIIEEHGSKVETARIEGADGEHGNVFSFVLPAAEGEMADHLRNYAT
jgi:DNA-binding response OmpR family regulator